MIDQCISLVFQRDKKVFIPEFGAIIYSEFNDNVDFNELLTFDDGKVIEEIQKQQSISEEEARKALEKYVKKIKSTVEKGKSHHIAGIGHLTKDKNEVLVIHKENDTETLNKDIEPSASDATNQETAPNQFDDLGEEAEKPDAEISETSNLFEDEPSLEKPVIDRTPLFPDVENEEDETVFSVEEENRFAYEEELKIGESEPEPKHGNGLKTAFLVIFPILLIVVGAYYYFNIYKDDTANDSSGMIESVKSIPEKEVLETKETTVTSEKPGNTAVSLASSPTTEQLDEDKTFCLIMGSFKVERNADKYQRRLKQKGLDSNKFKGRKNFYFVGIESIKGKSNAVRQLDEIKITVPSAWIYNKDLLL